MLIDIKKVIHCDYCETRHKTREAAIKCCGVMRTSVFYECPSCFRFFKLKRRVWDCIKYHRRLKEIREQDLAKYKKPTKKI